jgi:pilus assembly protein CpaD
MTAATLRLALPLAALALAACAAPPPAGSRYPAPTAVPTTLTHKVGFAGTASQPTPAEAMELASFLGTLPAGRALSAQIVGGGARAGDAAAEQLAAARVRAVARLVHGRLDVEPNLSLAVGGAGGTVAAGEVEVRIDTVEVLLPACPDWSRDPAFDFQNLPLSNLGCANAVNLGLMVADPADLASPTRIGPADGVREAEAITRYRTDKVKELEADVLTK